MAKLSEIIGAKDYDGVFVETPEDQDYTFILSIPFTCTYSQIRAICGSGTCTVQMKVNDSLVGSAVNVSSTLATQSISQSISVNDKIQINVSSTSSVSELEVILAR